MTQTFGQYEKLIERIADIPSAKEDKENIMRGLEENLVLAHWKYNAFYDFLKFIHYFYRNKFYIYDG